MTLPAGQQFSARCIAPPLTEEHLTTHFPSLLDTLPGLLKSDYTKLLEIVSQHKDNPAASLNIPSRRERDVMATKFESLPVSGPHRNPAFHLLWYVNELAVGRNPNEA